MPRIVAAKAMLKNVERSGDTLLLADGRRLVVAPEDATVTSIWMRSARLTLREGKLPGRGAAFNLSVTNEETGETIAARLNA